MKRILLLFSALMLSCIALWAHDVEIDGIYYNLDETNKTAEVTYAGKKPSSIFSEYIGKYEIPSIINYEAKDYIVTSIGDSTFYDCTELTSIKMPNTITSIGDAAFYGCVNLENENYISNIPVIPGIPGIPGMGTIRFIVDATAVDACYGIGFVGPFCNWDPNLTLQGTEFAENMFYIDMPSMSATEFGNVKILLLAEDGSSLWEYQVSDNGYDITGSEDYITLVDDYGTAINIVDGIDNVVIKIAILAVNGTPCEDVVPAASTEIEERSASIITEEEQNTENISTFILPNSIKYIGEYAFYNCQSIKSVELGNSVKYIGDYAFYKCTNLSMVNYLGTIEEWVSIEFENINNSPISYGNPTYYAEDLYINGELLTDVKITSATSVKDYVLYYCKSIETVEIGNSVNSIGESAFFGCESIKSLSIGENLNQIGDYAFASSTKLKSVTINAKQVPSYNYFNNLFGTYIAYLNVPCEALKAYELDNAFGQFKYIKCIEEEEEAPEDVEIEVDDNGNVNIKWPPTEGANSYKLVVSHAGDVICTLQFNSKGQLTSIDLGKRSASVGFEFTVTGLSQGSKYSYEMTALSEVNEVLDYYAGAFITNGYKEDDDVTTSINESITDANITVSGGTISADADFSIYNTIGLDVTAFNGSLQPGVYLVSIENNIVKVMVK